MGFVWYLFAVVFASLSDAIDHGKGAEPLYDLWHLTRDLTWIFIFLFARGLSVSDWYIAIPVFLLGHFIWEASYRRFKTCAPAWDNSFKMPLGKYLTVLGFGRGPAYEKEF